MIMLAAVLALLPIIWIAGGRLSRVADVALTHRRWAAAGLGVQIVILETPVARAPGAVLAAVHVASYLLLGVFFWHNRRIPGFPVLMLGSLTNFLAIVGNGGVMPATASAVQRAGIETGEAFANSAASSGSPLWFFGDVFAIPSGTPLANVFSIGDVLIIVGAGIFLWTATRPPRSSTAPADPREDHAMLDDQLSRDDLDDDLLDDSDRIEVLTAIVQHLVAINERTDERFRALELAIEALRNEAASATAAESAIR